ncbi:RND family transporter [Methanolobus sp. WCC1]|uniref:hydrophobe/amphiphile efflux-3 (HAE3) family transporter n=1 Tax=Methanolobus sp. WCC1 TaxID=3125782 RepID=UPI00324F2292
MSAKKRFEQIGAVIEKWPLGIIIVAILMMLIAFQGAGLIEHKSGTDTFVEKDSDLYQNYDHIYKQNFGNEVIMVLIDSDDVRESEVIEAIDDFDTLIARDKDVENVISMASLIKNTAYSVTGHSEIPNNYDSILSIIDLLPSAYVDQLMPDNTHTIIMVQLPGNIDEDNKERVLTRVERTIEVVDFPTGTNAVATGEPAFMIAMSEEMSSSLQTMLILAFVLMIFALLMVFRHVRWCLMPLPVVLIGLIWTFGAMGYLNIPMTMASMAVFPILIGLGADYAIQFHNRVEEELAKGESVEEAIIDTITHTGPAVGSAVVATCLGFIALLISPVPMIQDFGKMSLVGVLLCYIASMFVLVSILYLLDRREEKKKRRYPARQASVKKAEQKETAIGKVLSHVAMFSAKRPLIIIVLASVLAAGGLYADEHVGVQTETKDFVPQDMRALQNLNKLTTVVGGIDQINIIVRTDDVLDPDLLQWMLDFSEREEESNSYITGSSSIASLIESSHGSIPSDKDTITSVTDSMSSVVTDQYIEGSNLAVINLKLESDLPSEQITTAFDLVKSDMEWYDPPAGTTVTVTGSKVMTNSIIDALTSGRTTMGYLGMVIIFLGMLVIYRDWLKAVSTILPIVMVTGWIGGVMYLLDMPYNPLTATLGALAIGIGAEFTILMLERYFEEREKGMEPYDAMEKAASSVGPAIIASGSTVIFGFSALIVSSFPMISDFGKVTVIAVAFSLLSTVIVLPPIMVNLDRWRIKHQSSDKLENKNTKYSKVNV